MADVMRRLCNRLLRGDAPIIAFCTARQIASSHFGYAANRGGTIIDASVSASSFQRCASSGIRYCFVADPGQGAGATGNRPEARFAELRFVGCQMPQERCASPRFSQRLESQKSGSRHTRR